MSSSIKGTTEIQRRHTAERLNRATRSLALNPGCIQQRLAAAYSSGLVHVESKNLLDDEDRQEFEEIMAALMRVRSVGGEPPADATSAEMSDDEAIDLAVRILDIQGRYR